MNKKGMNLITLVVMLFLTMGCLTITVQIVTKIDVHKNIERASNNMDLLNIQEQANMAYANIYFDNLRKGIRRELTAQEIRLRMLKDGTGDIDLSKYNISVQDGNVIVSLKQNM